MKKLYFFLTLLFIANIVSAQILTENFSYAAGQLITANGWTAHSAGANPITVTAPGLTYAGHPGSGVGNAVTMATSGEDDNKTFTSTNSGSIYFSFLVNLSAAQAGGDYFIGFLQSSTVFPVRIYAKSDGAGGFFFGVSKGASTPVVYEATARSFGTTYFVVSKYTFNTGTTTDDVINVWVNPALGGSETTATIANVTGTSGDATSISAVYLRQGSAASASTQQVDAILAGTTWAEVTPSGAASATLTATSLTDFGNVCVNATVGPNSFTVTGTALTTVNITVGALAGFTYSTTTGGTYTSTLNLTQPGGAYSQDIFVKFTPTAVQSYNGNIPVGGGGATAINVAASGAGTIVPTLTSGAASAITQVSATVAGTITSTGCTAVTAYGIEWSLTTGFPNGSGTAVASTNLSGGNFSSDLTGLTASTTYYYHAYATNGGGTGYGSQQSFTTNSSTPPTGGLVISQIYGGGGNGGATYTADFVELFNSSSAPITMSGYSIQYGTATTVTTWTGVATLPSATIAAGGYYLIQMSAAGTVGIAIPTPDAVASPTINMSGTAGRVALVNGTTALVACPSSANYVDLVGFGTTAVCFQGTGPAGAQVSTTADFRKNNGCTQTNDNANDFEVLTVAPRNSATPVNICGAASPTLSATALTAFGNVCINTTAGPNSFTITGTTLTAVNITVGALAGFTYSTTAGGTYTTSLSLTQPGGAYSQQIFVQFTPTLVQSYNGNIPVGGGGATSINVAASGAGISTIPTVTTGGASAITTVSATLAGTIPANGCTAVTAYGVEWSLTNGFPNGSGTAVASTNLSGINFSSNVSGLSPGLTYYYHAYATNAGGTGYGAQQSFVTIAAPALSVSALTGFGNVCINTTAGPNSFTITGSNLTAANVTVGALTGFTYSTTVGGTYTSTLSLTQPGGSYSQQIFVKFTPTLVQSYNGNIPVGGGGATSVNVAATGAGVNSVPTVTTGGASAITTVSATLAGTIPDNGCSAVTAYGVEYSTTNGFPNGTGTPVASTNLSGINFSSNVAGLTQNTVYYYHAYATNGAGTGYGSQQTFTTLATTPTLNATTLAAFGNVCINTTAGPNSFTINGSSLNTTNISVGPLTGFSFSTTSGGTYTASLSLTQPGGTYSQAIFVKFTPTLVQSYNGNIPVSGGGAAAINVAASGAGVNTIATVTTGAASAITSISASLAGTIPANGCSAITAYGVEYSTTNGFPNGSGTAVPSTNLAGINFSSNVTGLAATTTYYYHAYATNNGGTAYGAQQTFITATPGLTVSAIAAFGNVCLNTTAGPNSFTITGTNLTTANVTVGALAGFTYSTTAGGTYTATLSLTQPGGAYSQTIFVNFTPTLVQSYNGNIPVGGGGAATANRSVTGAGVNTAPSVTSGAASAITQISATVAGTIPSIGCSAITAYGIEFSTTNGFPNGTGTAVASTNLSGVNFSSALTGLTPSTVYYYHAYATNPGGTSYGAQGSFTTSNPVLTATPLTAFGAVCINTTAGPNSFVINSNAVTAANINVGPLAGYSLSTTTGGTYTALLSLTHAAGPYTQTIFVKFSPTAVQSYNGSIPVSGGGAATINVTVSGSGSNTAATVVTGIATINNPNSVTLSGSVSNIGCSAVISYGIEYSGISGLANGLGTLAPSSNLSSGNFSSTLNGLVQGGKYYYKAYAVNSGGITYGAELSFTMTTIPAGFVIYNNPILRGTNLHYTYKGIKPGHYEIQIFNSMGQLVFQRELITPVDFIDDNFTVPGKLGSGVYSLHIVSPDFRDKKIFMIR